MIAKLFKVLSGLFDAQPHIRDTRNKRLINYWWSRVFYKTATLSKLANGHPTYPKPGHGLIYYYLVRGKVRYVGKTSERSLKWRMTRRQANGQIGYRYSIKRRMLNAYRCNRLTIKTREVPLANLDTIEKEEIALHAKTSRLWNIEHNQRSRILNRWFY